MCLGPEVQGKRILYVYVDAVRLSKTSPDKFWRNPAEGKKTKVKICFSPKSQYIFYAVRLGETRPIKFWRNQAEGK